MVVALTFEDIIAIHNETMKRLGLNPQPLIREGDLRSAIHRPAWAAHYNQADVVSQATGIARAHGFLDGNKRTAQRTLMVFLRVNGIDLSGERLHVAQLLEQLSGPDISDVEADAQMERFLRQRVTVVGRRSGLVNLSF
jgi:death-on-curing protein